MEAWWTGLAPLNQMLYSVAIFFSILFLWQFLSAFIGLGGSSDFDVVETDASELGPEVDDGFHESGIATFKLLSVRSVIAFGMLFGWASALYFESGLDLSAAIVRGIFWGAAGMALVAYFFFKVQRLTETGNLQLETCIGTDGEVYIDIPQNGAGQIRVIESGVVNYVSARSKGGDAIPHKTPVRVLKTLDMTTVEVEPTHS